MRIFRPIIRTDIVDRAENSWLPYRAVYGTDNDDRLIADDAASNMPTHGDDYVDARSGDDYVYAGGGNDTVLGGWGNDTLLGSWGDDEVSGGDGDDVISGYVGSDTLLGGLGNDTLNGSESPDQVAGMRLDGGEGDDVLTGKLKDSLYGGLGADKLAVEGGGGHLDGGAGNDELSLFAYYDQAGMGQFVTLLGGEGNDLIKVSLSYGRGIEGYLDGGAGDDRIYTNGDSGWQVLGGAGNDLLDLAGGGYSADAGDGNDRIEITGHSISINAGAGNDSIYFFHRYEAAESARLTLGSGSDTLNVSKGATGVLTITDFQVGAGGDVLDFKSLNVANGLGGKADPFKKGLVRLNQDGADTVIELAIDPSAQDRVFQAYARLENVDAASLTAANFKQSVTPTLVVNPLPLSGAPAKVFAQEDEVTSLGLSQPSDPNGSSLSILLEAGPSLGYLVTRDGRAVSAGSGLTVDEYAGLMFHPSSTPNVFGKSDPLRFSFTDAQGSRTVSVVELEVLPVPDAPVFMPPPAFSYCDTGDSVFRVQLASYVSDADGDTDFLWTAHSTDGSDLPSWLTLNAHTGELTGIPPYGTLGPITLNVTLVDPSRLQGRHAITLQQVGASRTGSSDNDSLTGSSAGDVLRGLTGDDTLDGGIGIDTLDGGDGNDVFFVDNLGDVLVDSLGVDTVHSTVNWTLKAGFEHLTLAGNEDLSGSGNSERNELLGNSGSNALSGADGQDTLRGQGGNDVLIGGSGRDRFLFERNAQTNGFDEIGDMQVGIRGDVIDLHRLLSSSNIDALDGNQAGGDDLDSVTAPQLLRGQQLFVMDALLQDQPLDPILLADLLEGFTTEGSLKHAIVIHDLDGGTGFLCTASDLDGSHTFSSNELEIIAQIMPDGGSLNGLLTQNFAGLRPTSSQFETSQLEPICLLQALA